MNKTKDGNFVRLLMELGKVRITFAVTLTTLFGYLLANKTFDIYLIMPVLGIFLLACASSALNHYQEREYDAIMERTKDRPIPSGRISANGAMRIAIAMAVIGSLMLYYGAGFLEMQLGLLALIWYNAIYTPLKRKTAYAVIPGSVIGSIPPVVGWVAGGGSLTDPKVAAIAFFFFIWQVPHFWLLLLKYGKEYEQAGYPSLTSVYSDAQLKRITFIWTAATAVSCLFFPLFKLVGSFFTTLLIVAFCIWLVVSFSKLLTAGNQKMSLRKYFLNINIFMLLVILSLSVDAVLM